MRLSPGLHALLRAGARDAGLSLNEYCVQRLAALSGGSETTAPGVVRRAAELFGEQLVGVALYGSWARGEAVEGSDVDLLVAVGPDVRLARGLYDEWDGVPLEWRGRRVEPHFVHLPEPGSAASGLWAEAAIDGIVLYERGLRLSRWLVEVRHQITDGRIVRRSAHGQPYWTRSDVG